MSSSPVGRFLRGALLFLAAAFMVPAKAANYSDLWWNPDEPGWGLTIADHNTNIFAVWLTYREDSSPTWFVMSGGVLSEDRKTFSASIYQTAAPLDADGQVNLAGLAVTRVGHATLDFAPTDLAAGKARFSYTVGEISGSKAIERQGFGNAPTSWGYDLSDMWWNPEQSGWGLSLTQHGSTTFGVLYTYDAAGHPTFSVMSGMMSQFTGLYGRAYSVQGPYFGGPYDATKLRVTDVGHGIMYIEGFPVGDANGPWSPTFVELDTYLHGKRASHGLVPMEFGEARPTPVIPVIED